MSHILDEVAQEAARTVNPHSLKGEVIRVRCRFDVYKEFKTFELDRKGKLKTSEAVIVYLLRCARKLEDASHPTRRVI